MTVSADISQQYIGCYRDDTADSVMKGNIYTNASMTVDTCLQFCQKSTYMYFGLEVQILYFRCNCHSYKYIL